MDLFHVRSLSRVMAEAGNVCREAAVGGEASAALVDAPTATMEDLFPAASKLSTPSA